MIAVTQALLIYVALAQASYETQLELCKAYSEVGELMMEGRQRGADMADLMAGQTDANYRRILTAAYSAPKWGTLERKQEAIREFKNQIYLECIKQVDASGQYD